MSFILYLFIVVFLIISPLRWWDQLFQKSLLILDKWREKTIGHRYQKIILFLAMSHDQVQNVNLPRYKYYTDIIVTSLNYSRQFGSSVAPVFKVVRNLLVCDYQFERKFQREICGAIVQFMMTALVTWFFIISSIYIVQLEVPFFIFALIFLLQIGGGAIFGICYQRSKKRNFCWYDLYFKSLLQFSALAKIGIPIQKVITMSGISTLLEGPFSMINKRMEKSLLLWQRKGTPILESVSDCIDEIIFLQKEAFDKFLGKLVMLKFLILSFFFLPCYLLYLFWIFGSFFESSY